MIMFINTVCEFAQTQGSAMTMQHLPPYCPRCLGTDLFWDWLYKHRRPRPVCKDCGWGSVEEYLEDRRNNGPRHLRPRE